MRSYGLHQFTHARFGLVAFEHTSYVPDGHPNIRVVICTPERRGVQARGNALPVVAERGGAQRGPNDSAAVNRRERCPAR